MLADIETQIFQELYEKQKENRKYSFDEISGLLDNVEQLLKLSVLDQKLQPYWNLSKDMISNMKNLEKNKKEGGYFIELLDHVVSIKLEGNENIAQYQNRFYSALGGLQNMFVHLHKGISLIPLPDKDTGLFAYTSKARVAVQRNEKVSCCYIDVKNRKASSMGIVEDNMEDAIIKLQETQEWCNILYTGKTFNAPMKESVIPILISKYNHELYRGKNK